MLEKTISNAISFIKEIETYFSRRHELRKFLFSLRGFCLTTKNRKKNSNEKTFSPHFFFPVKGLKSKRSGANRQQEKGGETTTTTHHG